NRTRTRRRPRPRNCSGISYGHRIQFDASRFQTQVASAHTLEDEAEDEPLRMTAPHYDLVIIGIGMGGGMLAYALKDTGMKILLLERGDFLPQEPENWSPEAVFDRKRYKPPETWYDATGKPFSP